MLDRLAREKAVGVIAAGNFSVMAAVLRRAAAMAARHLGHWEIIDYASDTKPDVPSGTARELAETLAQGRALPLATTAPDRRASLINPATIRSGQYAVW